MGQLRERPKGFWVTRSWAQGLKHRPPVLSSLHPGGLRQLESADHGSCKLLVPAAAPAHPPPCLLPSKPCLTQSSTNAVFEPPLLPCSPFTTLGYRGVAENQQEPEGGNHELKVYIKRVQPAGYVQPRAAVNGAQHTFLNFLKTLRNVLATVVQFIH